MESISKSAFLPFLRGQSLNWLKIEVVVQMQVVEVLSVDQKVKHVVALPTDVETCLNPVEFSQLEELGGLKSFEQISFVLRLWFFVMQRIQNPTLKKLLITHSNFDGVSLRAVFFKPIWHQGDVASTSCDSCALVKRSWRPVEIDAICSVFCEEGLLRQKWFDSIGKSKVLKLFVSNCILVDLRIKFFKLLVLIGRHRVDYLVIVEDRDFWIIAFNKAYCREMIGA